jgi:Lar family restriction alleviation protein
MEGCIECGGKDKHIGFCSKWRAESNSILSDGVIKPCPFCGEQPVWTAWDDPYTYELLYCATCYESARRTVDCVGEDKEDIIRRWNERIYND